MPDDETSIVQSPRDYSEVIEQLDSAKLQGLLEEHLTTLVEMVTGAAASGKMGLLVSVGKGVQGLLKYRNFRQFGEEFRRLRDKERIPGDFAEKKYGFQSWVELMTIIDEECPDEERLEALKAAFYAINKIGQGDADVIVEYQLWQIAKELNSGDIILLRSMYMHVNNRFGDTRPAWLANMTKVSGLVIPELLERHEKRLTDMLLMTGRTAVGADLQHGHLSGIDVRNNRLSQLGIRFCKNIETYKIDLASATDSKQK